MSWPVRADALLIDLDGTLVDSHASIAALWNSWSRRYGVDPGLVLSITPGAHRLLAALPDDSWALVTACTEELARARLRAADLPVPAMLIGSDTAIDDGGGVPAGKPDPDGYLAAAARLGCAPERSVVLEDAPAGVAAGHAAGMRVIAVPPAAAGPLNPPDLSVPGLEYLHIGRNGHAITVGRHE